MSEPLIEASVFLYSGYDGYLPSATLVFSGKSIGSQETPVILKGSGNNYLLVKEGGTADYVTVSDYDSYAEVCSGGTIGQLTITGYGVVSVHEGAVVDVAEIKADGRLELDGQGRSLTIAGVLDMRDGAVAERVTLLSGGLIRLSGGNAAISKVPSLAGQLQISDGVAKEIVISKGGHVYISGGTLEDATFMDGSALDTMTGNPDGWTIANATFHKGAFARMYAGTKLVGVIQTAIAFSLQGAVDASKATMDFLLTEREAGEDAFISDWTKCAAGAVKLTVSDAQAAGTYILADNTGTFAASVSLRCGTFAEMAFTATEVPVVYHNSVYTLSLTSDTLAVAATDFQTSGSADALTWADINGAESYALEMACGTQTLALNLDSQNVELLGLANGNYAWQVRNTAEADNWQTGKAFTQAEALEGPQELVATGEAPNALFFAKADGVWDNEYVALNTLTGETAQLEGKTKITDVFTGVTGEENASILMLDAFASSTQQAAETRSVELDTHGIAFFLDDIYSAAPSSVPEAEASGQRFSAIDTIIATSGDDIIDLTSDRYDLAGDGVTILGGAGDDIIWANGGDDILCGGAGNDTLHGGGGADIFCFGEGWGKDTIGQLSGDGNTVTLWFSQNSETLNLSFTQDGNDTIITAFSTGDAIRAVGMSVSIDDCRFGAAAGYEAIYNTLASLGAFA